MEEIRENALENEIEKRCKGVLNGYERPALQLSASISMPIIGTCFIQ